MTRRKHHDPRDRESKGCVTVPPAGYSTPSLCLAWWSRSCSQRACVDGSRRTPTSQEEKLRPRGVTLRTAKIRPRLVSLVPLGAAPGEQDF